MNVLVMGGTQFNGLALVDELVRQGHDVSVCNRGRTESDIPASVGRLVADRTDHDQLRRVLGNTEWDCVYDMTAYYPADVEIMIDLFRDRVGHYVFASSTAIYGSGDEPITESHPEARGADQIEYGLHKLLCEDRLRDAHRDHGFPATTVPFAMVVGPHNAITDRERRMFTRIHEGRPVLVPGDGTTRLVLGDVDDQARGLVTMMGDPGVFGRRYNLTGNDPLTRLEYVAAAAAAVGREPQVVFIPADLMESVWTGEQSLVIGRSSGAINVRKSTSGAAVSAPRRSLRGMRFGLCMSLVQQLAPNIHWWDQDTVFAIDRLQADTDWSPQETAVSMLDRAHDWWLANPDSRPEYDWTTEDQLLGLVAAR